MINFGGLFGLISAICIVFLALRMVVKIVLNLPGMSLKNVPAGLKKPIQFINKYHRLVGIVAVTAVIAHFVLQYQKLGFIPTGGLLAGVAMLLQAGAGMALKAQKDKEKRKRFVVAHTFWGAALILAVLNHRLKVF